jgi:hypothetical protein
MIPLTDPIWSQFQANYTDGRTVAGLLARAYSGKSLDTWYDDLFQEICHQYTVSQAAYPAAPHLIALAKKNEPFRKHLLILLGACYAYAEETLGASLPPDIREAWEQSSQEALPLLLGVLAARQTSPAEFLYLLSSLAAFRGYPSLARALESLDYEDE